MTFFLGRREDVLRTHIRTCRVQWCVVSQIPILKTSKNSKRQKEQHRLVRQWEQHEYYTILRNVRKLYQN
jgi:hypothetical protein